MAQTATIYALTIELTDMDRNIYASLDLRLAQQPSETLEHVWARVLAYCLEYAEGIAFSAGIAAGNEPAIAIRDMTGHMTAWIEVGMPDADRLHRASKSADRVAVYTQRAALLKQQLAGSRIHRAEAIPIYEVERPLLDALVRLTERRMTLAIVVTEGQLYLEIGGEQLAGKMIAHQLE